MRIESILVEYWRNFEWFGRGLNRLFGHFLHRPCGGAAGGEWHRRGAVRWWGHHATPQPEHMPSRWCPGFAGRRRHDSDKTPVCAAGTQGPQNSHLPVCWISPFLPEGRVYGSRLVFVSVRTIKRHHHHRVCQTLRFLSSQFCRTEHSVFRQQFHPCSCICIMT